MIDFDEVKDKTSEELYALLKEKYKDDAEDMADILRTEKESVNDSEEVRQREALQLVTYLGDWG
jgi:hypothetical protein